MGGGEGGTAEKLLPIGLRGPFGNNVVADIEGELFMVGFVSEAGITFAGRHLLIDLYDCQVHGEMEIIRAVLIESCIATGATVLFSHLHPFPGGGVSGAVILAESHCSIHSWPENGFISLDIFVCGDCNPYKAIPILEQYFKPRMSKISLQRRGIMDYPRP